MLAHFKARSWFAVLLYVGWMHHAQAQVVVGTEDRHTTTTSFWLSPDRRFLAFEVRTVDLPVAIGNRKMNAISALFLKPVDCEDSLCLGNYKSFEVYWSPDSKYLVLLKEYYTHNSDVDVYRVTKSAGQSMVLDLIFRRDALALPREQSWTNWTFGKWDLDKNVVVIVQADDDYPRIHEKIEIEVPLGAKPIKSVSLTEEFPR